MKYEPKQAVLLDPEGKTMTFSIGTKVISSFNSSQIKLDKMPSWIKGLKVEEA
jgi:hypothetical protein